MKKTFGKVCQQGVRGLFSDGRQSLIKRINRMEN